MKTYNIEKQQLLQNVSKWQDIWNILPLIDSFLVYCKHWLPKRELANSAAGIQTQDPKFAVSFSLTTWTDNFSRLDSVYKERKLKKGDMEKIFEGIVNDDEGKDDASGLYYKSGKTGPGRRQSGSRAKVVYQASQSVAFEHAKCWNWMPRWQ